MGKNLVLWRVQVDTKTAEDHAQAELSKLKVATLQITYNVHLDCSSY